MKRFLVNLCFLAASPLGLIGFVVGFVWISLYNGFLWAETLAAEEMGVRHEESR